MLRQVDPISALKAGIFGTAVMTIVMYSLPFIGLPAMDIMAALGVVFPVKISPYILGALVHFTNGIVIALVFAAFFHPWLPGPSWLRGALFSLLPWLFAITLLGPSLHFAAQISGADAPTAVNPCAVSNPRTPANPCAASNPCATRAPARNPCAAPVNPCAPGAPFQGNIPPQLLSLVAHWIYGGILGAFYRPRI